ncbi:MAG: hypothetical protein ACPGTQ_12105 [Colwellia sp.]
MKVEFFALVGIGFSHEAMVLVAQEIKGFYHSGHRGDNFTKTYCKKEIAAKARSYKRHRPNGGFCSGFNQRGALFFALPPKRSSFLSALILFICGQNGLSLVLTQKRS